MIDVLFDALRCAVIAFGALGLGWWVAAPGRPSWLLILAPLFTPNLLISYAWARFAYELGRWPALILVFYSAVLVLKLVPLAAVARHFFPSPLQPEGAFCYALATGGVPGKDPRFKVRAAGPVPWIVAALLFLIAFSEFELASLWSLKTWPVRLFDAHAGGLKLTESLRLAAWPAFWQATVLAAMLWTTRRPVPRAEPESATLLPGSRSRSRLAFVIASATVVTLWPLGFVMALALAGFQTLGRNTVFPADLAASCAFASMTAVLAWLISGFGPKRSATVTIAAALPGLLGALVVALFILALFQLPGLRTIYDTPLPLLIALIIIVIPGALLLRWLIEVQRPADALHVARLARSRWLRWEMSGKLKFSAIALLGCWTWFDFTASSILAPVGLTPVFVRLHNLAHYGQTAALSALLLAATVVPILVLALTLGAARLYARRDAR
ncbi:MAG: hypothetical protein ABI680_01755 [Chthoniobacteraceae bacterium]